MKIEDTLNSFSGSLFKKSKRDSGRTRKQEFRPSSLPICPLKWALNGIINNGEAPEEDSLNMEFYTGIGTVVHSALQRWSGFHGKMYGDWKLKFDTTYDNKTFPEKLKSRLSTPGTRFEGTLTSYKIQKSKTGPIFYNDKGEVFTKDEPGLKMAEYEELVVRCPKTKLLGHVDALVPHKDGYIIVDFKTSGVEKILDMEEPPIAYHHQVHTYWYLLSQYGPWDWDKFKYRGPLKIYGAAIFMITRDNPFFKEDVQTKIFISEELDLAVVNRNYKNYRIGKEAIETKNLTKAIERRICSCKEDTEGCEFSVMGCIRGKEVVAKNVKDVLKDL